MNPIGTALEDIKAGQLVGIDPETGRLVVFRQNTFSRVISIQACKDYLDTMFYNKIALHGQAHLPDDLPTPVIVDANPPA